MKRASKKTWSLSFLLLVCIVISTFLVGCQNTKSRDIEVEQTSPLTMDLDKLLAYKDSYVGDNSAVGGILFGLPGNIYANNYYLDTGVIPFAIEVDYGLNSNTNLKEEDLEKYWTEENTQKVFLNNAAAFFILVKNVDEVRFNLNTAKKRTFRISREEMEKFFGKDLRKYALDKSLWTKEVIEDSINNSENRQKFFSTYKIN